VIAGPSGQMETMLEATARLRAAGYGENWIAEDGKLRCFTCTATYKPESVTVDEVVRFEGPSDPGDEAILFALRSVRPSRPVLRSLWSAHIGRGCHGHRRSRPHPAVTVPSNNHSRPGGLGPAAEVVPHKRPTGSSGPAWRCTFAQGLSTTLAPVV